MGSFIPGNVRVKYEVQYGDLYKSCNMYSINLEFIFVPCFKIPFIVIYQTH